MRNQKADGKQNLYKRFQAKELLIKYKESALFFSSSRKDKNEQYFLVLPGSHIFDSNLNW
jgi:hypothetical protein